MNAATRAPVFGPLNFKSTEGILLLVSLLVAYALRSENALFLPGIAIGMGYVLFRLWTRPQLGFIALLCLVYALPAVPTMGDVPSLCFAAAAAIWSIACLREWVRAGAVSLPQWMTYVIAGCLLLLAVNFVIAGHNGVDTRAWLRATASILPLGLIIPAILLKQPPADMSWRWIALTVGLIAFSFSVEVLWVYLHNQLWQGLEYDSAVAQKFLASPTGQYIQNYDNMIQVGRPMLLRVASLLPEAQGILLPVRAVGWFAASIALPVRKVRWLAIAASTICLCAVCTTLTRSMLCSVLLVQGIIALYCFCIRLYRMRLLRKLVFQFVVTIVFLLAFNVFVVMQSRMVALLEEVKEYQVAELLLDILRLDSKTIALKTDYRTETNYRLQEYVTVANLFAKSPMLGNGMGTQITIRFPSVAGKEITYHPRYVHNWALYWLMTGGLVAAVLFGTYLFAPLMNLRRLNLPEHEILRYAVLSVSLVLIIYGMFFAVCVTPPFTLLMAVLMDFTLQQYTQAQGRA